MSDSYPMAEGVAAQRSVIGSMLIDDRCVGVVLAQLRAEDFTDPTCRNTFTAIRRLKLEGKPIDPVTVTDAVSGGQEYIRWARSVLEETPTAANVEAYLPIVRERAAEAQMDALAVRLLDSRGLEEKSAVVRKMSGLLSAASRMPRMTGPELARDFLSRMAGKEKPKYLPWGIPTADRTVYAELGDMVLLGGYASSGKTLLSIMMALTQAKRYKVGYYTLETQPEKMADRVFSHLSGVPLETIKVRDFGEADWEKLARAANDFVTGCPFDVIRAAGSLVDDIAADAVARGYQVVYVDYLQLIEAPGVRPGDRYAAVTTVSRALKLFAQRTGTNEILKSAETRAAKLTDGELALINQQALRPLVEADVFTFKLAACDDQVDRNHERFTGETLEGLAKLFVGRTVLTDHRWSAGSQTARVYAASVEREGEVKRLILRCYMPRTEQTAGTITAIETGILRECSVGCAVERAA